MTTASLDMLVEKYRELTAAKKALTRAYEEEVAPYNEALKRLGEEMLIKMNELGAQNVKTAHGTAYVHVAKSTEINDFDRFWEMVKKEDRPELLQRRVSASEVEVWNETHPDTPVPGVNITQTRSVRVRAK